MANDNRIAGTSNARADQGMTSDQIRAAGGKGWARPMSEINSILAEHGYPEVSGAGDLNAFLWGLRTDDLDSFQELLKELLPNVDTETAPGDLNPKAPGTGYLGM